MGHFEGVQRHQSLFHSLAEPHDLQNFERPEVKEKRRLRDSWGHWQPVTFAIESKRAVTTAWRNIEGTSEEWEGMKVKERLDFGGLGARGQPAQPVATWLDPDTHPQSTLVSSLLGVLLQYIMASSYGFVLENEHFALQTKHTLCYDILTPGDLYSTSKFCIHCIISALTCESELKLSKRALFSIFISVRCFSLIVYLPLDLWI